MVGLYGQYDNLNKVKKDQRGGVAPMLACVLVENVKERWEREEIQGGSKINRVFSFIMESAFEMQRDMYQENGFF